jgi:hypothetical protein
MVSYDLLVNKAKKGFIMNEEHIMREFLVYYDDVHCVLQREKNTGLLLEKIGKEFWKPEENRRFSEKRGVYVFGIRASKGFTPYYVGKTKINFQFELFSHRNINIFNRVIAENNGTPIVFLIYPKKISVYTKRDIEKIEQFLIEVAYAKNIYIKNKQGLPSWCINGVWRCGPGKATKEASKFKIMMGLNKYL